MSICSILLIVVIVFIFVMSCVTAHREYCRMIESDNALRRAIREREERQLQKEKILEKLFSDIEAGVYDREEKL